jgi:hypothetical protein
LKEAGLREAGLEDRRGEIVRVYERVTEIIFQRLGPTFGSRTIAAIAKNVQARQSRSHQILAYLTISEKGIGWAGFRAHFDEVGEEEVGASLEEFLDEFFEALSNLIGRLILGQLFKEAEESAHRGDD